MGCAVNIDNKTAKKGYIGIDLENGLVLYKQSMYGDVINTFDFKKSNVFVDISTNAKAGVFNDLRILAGLAVNASEEYEKIASNAKRELENLKILYELLLKENAVIRENYDRVCKCILKKQDKGDR